MGLKSAPVASSPSVKATQSPCSATFLRRPRQASIKRGTATAGIAPIRRVLPTTSIISRADIANRPSS